MHILRENMPRASEHVVRVHTFRERVMPAHLERKHVESERTRRESAYISRERAKASTRLEGNHFERERRRVHIMIENMSRASDHVLRVHTSRERVMPAHLEISQFNLYSRSHFSTSSQSRRLSRHGIHVADCRVGWQCAACLAEEDTRRGVGEIGKWRLRGADEGHHDAQRRCSRQLGLLGDASLRDSLCS